MDAGQKKKTASSRAKASSTESKQQGRKMPPSVTTDEQASSSSALDDHIAEFSLPSSSDLIEPFQKHLNIGGSEDGTGPKNRYSMLNPPANLDVVTEAASEAFDHPNSDDLPGSNDGREEDRMGEDGYPLIVDLGRSERQSRLARQRLIDEVIQEQAFDQDVIEELERANMRRVFEEIEEGQDEEHLAQRRRATANGIVSGEDALTPRVEAAIANYMVRKYADPTNNNRIGVHIEEREEPGPSSLQLDRPVNILPGSRNLVERPVNRVISRGRRASPLAEKRNPRGFGAMSWRAANAVDDSPLGWQGAKSTLKERISYMYCKDVLADVYFIVGKDDMRQRIPAHKFILSVGSVVFDAMFNGGLTPQNSRDPLEIELPDVEVPAFRSLLRFLYSDEVEIGPESVITTLYTAKKYAVPAMESACVEFLKQSLGADNAFMLLTQARLFDEQQLAKLCLEIIDKNTYDALNGEGFTDIDLDTLCVVLARDTLRIREAQLFQAVVRWSTEECARRGLEATTENRRAVLGHAVQLIRFPLMTIEEFAQSAAQSGLLTDREVVNLFLYFTVNPKPSIGFNDNPRCSVAGKELVVSRFQRIEGRWGYSGTPDRIKFTVDRKIYVVGFGLYGAIHGSHEYQCIIQVIHCGTGKVLAQNDTSFICDGSSSTCRVSFREPVEITPGVTYIASACLKGMDSHYGTKGLRRIVHQSATGGVVTFQFTYAAGNNNGTSVEDGQIPEIIFYTNNG
ncbi:BTB/POZ domain-containing protein 2, variant 2 [Parelaphostrongylus tenuis]|uniref:BTB/POZ domain-containing protein 2, variant 2 n=2 Tax=Parelaphostrongylus tenuis TaxID=148309 RepID=A0AAD5N114_PARTN|nr:BTB/POZ domain-containing protein 2, variant 2 [Parelaphostrongylus tenuis]